MFRRNAESRGHRPRDRGTHVVGANLSQEGWGAQALLALARQLTPEAHERGSSVRVRLLPNLITLLLGLFALAAPAAIAQTSDPGGATPADGSGYAGSRGPRWRAVLRSTNGFRARHPLGF